MRNRIGHFEVAVGSRPAGMNDPLRNSLVIEMGYLFPESEIFQERRTALPGFQRILVVSDDDALIGRESIPEPRQRFDAWRLPVQRLGISQDLRVSESPLPSSFSPSTRSKQLTCPSTSDEPIRATTAFESSLAPLQVDVSGDLADRNPRTYTVHRSRT